MKDVADRARVTIGTVSHVINHTASISEETTRRVRKAIEELNYVPNNIARNMRAKTNNRVGLMIPNLTNNFHASIMWFISWATNILWIGRRMSFAV